MPVAATLSGWLEEGEAEEAGEEAGGEAGEEADAFEDLDLSGLARLDTMVTGMEYAGEHRTSWSSQKV